MSRHLGPALCAVALLALTACGGDDDSSSTSGPTSSIGVDGDGSSVPGSTAPGGSTSIPGSTGTTTAPGSATTTAGGGTGTGTTLAGDGAGAGTTNPDTPTTPAPGPTNAIPQSDSDLTLLADGLGPLKFGADSNDVVAAISAVVGDPVSDAPATYPVSGANGTFQSEDGELGFAQPFGRTVCWLDGLCIENGGTAAGPYSFLGWYYAATGPDLLAAPDGLDVGSTWAQFRNSITVDPGGCATVGHGTSYGVGLNLLSSGTPFVTTDDNGTETNGTPDPADVVVQQMEAGQQVLFLMDDC